MSREKVAREVAERVAERVFDQRSKHNYRNVEVHLSESVLADLIRGAIKIAFDHFPEPKELEEDCGSVSWPDRDKEDRLKGVSR